MTGTMTPNRYRVTRRRSETADTVTIELAPLDEPLVPPLPGQFTMIYAYGVGEVPISVSATDHGTIVHTLRSVGAVTSALHDAAPGVVLGLRGPYGSDWGLPAPAGSDLVIVGGGIGLAPLRPVIYHAIEQRQRYGRIAVLIGARTPGDLLFTDEYDKWCAGGLGVRATVDRADATWTGRVGVVTTLIDDMDLHPASTVAFVCGPDAMMRFSARALVEHGMAPASIRVSLERNMRCGAALCGHCQLGPVMVCREGPVFGYDRAEPWFVQKEL